jgi:hypothetical protein
VIFLVYCFIVLLFAFIIFFLGILIAPLRVLGALISNQKKKILELWIRTVELPGSFLLLAVETYRILVEWMLLRRNNLVEDFTIYDMWSPERETAKAGRIWLILSVPTLIIFSLALVLLYDGALCGPFGCDMNSAFFSPWFVIPLASINSFFLVRLPLTLRNELTNLEISRHPSVHVRRLTFRSAFWSYILILVEVLIPMLFIFLLLLGLVV